MNIWGGILAYKVGNYNDPFSPAIYIEYTLALYKKTYMLKEKKAIAFFSISIPRTISRPCENSFCFRTLVTDIKATWMFDGGTFLEGQ